VALDKVPQVALQVTAVLVVLATVAVNAVFCISTKVAVVGATLIVTVDAALDREPAANADATTSTEVRIRRTGEQRRPAMS